MDNTIIVSIGRNIGDSPMDDEMWGDFRDQVFRLVEAHTETIHFFGDGVGVYEGNEEESYTIIGTFSESDKYNHTLFVELCEIADDFWQDSIAVTIGTTSFAKAAWAKKRRRFQAAYSG